MRSNVLWSLHVMILLGSAYSKSIQKAIHDNNSTEINISLLEYQIGNNTTNDKFLHDKYSVSVKVTSSVGNTDKPRHETRRRIKHKRPKIHNNDDSKAEIHSSEYIAASEHLAVTEIPPGANVAFIKQLQARKETSAHQNTDSIHPFQITISKYNETNGDTLVEESEISLNSFRFNDTRDNNEENVPLARSVAHTQSFNSLIQNLTDDTKTEFSDNVQRLNLNVDLNHHYNTSTLNIKKHNITLEDVLPQVYSQPSKFYSEPAKFYSEPAKVYGEPAKVYSEPAKIYSEPAKVYGEPAKFYSKPASLYLDTEPEKPEWDITQNDTSTDNQTDVNLEVTTNESDVSSSPSTHNDIERPATEDNYDINDKSTENCKEDNCKVGYVVHGRQYRKYRVEERTPDGFIVGEYGVVRNEDGNLRGVRYTADSEASPRLIYEALMKFLQL